MKLSKRSFLTSLALGAAVVVAAACGSDSKEEPTGGAQTGAQATTAAGATQAAADYTPAPKEQQVFRLGYTQPDFLDPHKSQFTQDIGIERLTFRGLFFTDEKGTSIPAVAKEVPTQQNGGISADGKTLKIALKDGQKWSDGSALTAKDFEYSLKRALNPKLAGPYAGELFNIVGAEEYYTALGTQSNPKTPSAEQLTALREAISVKAVDDKTLQIQLKNPQPTMPIILGMWMAYPVKQSVVEAGGAAPDNTQWATKAGSVIGNGPFILKEYREKDRIVLEANPNYTAGTMPKLQRLEMRIVEDPEVSFNAFQTGELDLSSVPTSKVPVVDGDPNLKKQNVRAPDPTNFWLIFQNQVKPLENQKVRMAMAKAIDRDAFVKVTLAGVGEPTTLFMHKDVPGSVASDGDVVKYDVAAAKRLLQEAGFPNGQGFPELTLISSQAATSVAQAEFVQKQLKDNLGINIKLEVVDARTRSSRYSNSQFELAIGGWHEDYHDPENWLPVLLQSDSTNNQWKYSNAKFDELVKQARFEQNNEKRIDLYRQAHKLALEDAAVGPLYSRTSNVVVSPKVKGFKPNAQDAGFTGNFNIDQVEIAK
jgi:oligopeptide transport system substrate-binding protein